MKLVQKRSRKTGLPPGTLVHIGEKKTDKVTITAFNYAGTRCDERRDLSLAVLAPPTDGSVTGWMSGAFTIWTFWNRSGNSSSSIPSS
jgi:hypothetical protein